MKKFQKVIEIFLFLCASILLLFFLYEKYRLGLVRYFDMDEYAYLNWTAHMVRGDMPYRDFLYQLPPGFLIILAPVFFVSRDPTFPLTGGRIIAFFIQAALIFITGLLFYKIRKSWTAILAALFLAFLPMPSDKLMEIRPDTAGVLFAMLGTLLQVVWMEREKKSSSVIMFLSGLSYGFSVFILQKTIPHAAVAAVFALVWLARRKKSLMTIVPFAAGGAILFIIFAFWAVLHGIGASVWYLIVKFPGEAAQMMKSFFFFPWSLFLWNDIYYGKPGTNWGFILNQAIWTVGSIMMAVRLLVPAVARGKKHIESELLLAGTAVVQFVYFRYFMPFQYIQYLTPLAVFVSFYAADAVNELYAWAKNSLKIHMMTCAFIVVLFILVVQGYRDVNTVKSGWTNDYDKKTIEQLLRTIGTHEYILDLVGTTLYYPSPYYVSCLPFGQFAPFLSRPLPSLPAALEKTKTKYIYQGIVKRVSSLSTEDQAYVEEHFTSIGDGSLLVRVF